MKSYIKTPDEVYFEVGDDIPVNPRCIPCAPRPTINHKLDSTWADHPDSPSIWILKTADELGLEKDFQLQEFIDSNKEVVAVAVWVAQLHGITKAEAIQQLKAIYRNL